MRQGVLKRQVAVTLPGSTAKYSERSTTNAWQQLPSETLSAARETEDSDMHVLPANAKRGLAGLRTTFSNAAKNSSRLGSDEMQRHAFQPGNGVIGYG